MKFGLASYTSVGIRNSEVITSLSNDLEDYLLSRCYGGDIKLYVIGIICVAPQFEQFNKIKKPKYTKGKKILKPDGIPITIEDAFEYSIKIDFEAFSNADEQGAKEILAKEILASLSILEQMKSTIKDFDQINFNADLENYFKHI